MPRKLHSAARRCRMAGYRAMLVLPVLACALAGQLAGAAEIRMGQTAEISGRIVRLGDIARITDADSQFARQLEQVEVAPAPPAGVRRPLSLAEVRQRLQSLGFDQSQIEFSGYGQVMLTSVAVRRNDTQPAATQALRQVAHWQQDRAAQLVSEAVQRTINAGTPDLGPVSVEAELQPQHALVILAGRADSMQITGGQPPWNRRQTMLVQLLDRQGNLQQVPVIVRCEPHPQVLAARFNLPAGHVVRAEDLVWQQQKRPAGPQPLPADLTGRETVRPLRQGQPITREDVKSVPLIRRNDIVVVHSTAPGIRVSTEMKSRSEGARGDRVILVTLDGREQVAARVVGLQEAVVEATADVTTSGRPAVPRAVPQAVPQPVLQRAVPGSRPLTRRPVVGNSDVRNADAFRFEPNGPVFERQNQNRARFPDVRREQQR